MSEIDDELQGKLELKPLFERMKEELEDIPEIDLAKVNYLFVYLIDYFRC